MTNEPMNADEARQEARAQVVATIDGRDYTRGELQDAFERVENRAHWKAPINAMVECTLAEAKVIRYAIGFFTGSIPTVTLCSNGQFHFEADGYWTAIGA